MSGTCAGLRLRAGEATVVVVDDAHCSRGVCLTEGSGFISPDLAAVRCTKASYRRTKIVLRLIYFNPISGSRSMLFKARLTPRGIP